MRKRVRLNAAEGYYVDSAESKQLGTARVIGTKTNLW